MGKKSGKSGKKKLRPKLTPVENSPRTDHELDDAGLGFDDIVPSSSSSSAQIPCQSLIKSLSRDDAAVEVAPKDGPQIADIVDSNINNGKAEGVTRSSASDKNPSGDPPLSNLDSACASTSDAEEKTATKLSVDDAYVKDPFNEVESVEVGTEYVECDASADINIHSNLAAIEKDEPRPRKVLEPFSHSDDLKSFPSQLSQDLDDISLDTTPAPPLIRAFNGIHNGISVAAISNLSFSFKDCNESEAFVFLTASLRETLGDDARGVTDETLSRYIRWKPDVERAANRFHGNQAFRKENSYIFDDKPMLLSQDPKMTFLLQNGMVVAPEEVFAKDGSGIMMIRGSQWDISAHDCTDQDASRAIFYTLQLILERNTLDPMRGITIILDLEGALRKNFSRRLPHLFSKAAGCFPLRIQAVYVLSSQWWFPAAGNRKLGFSAKMQTRIHFLKNKSALYEYIEKDVLLEVYSFDIQSWISSSVMHEVESS